MPGGLNPTGRRLSVEEREFLAPREAARGCEYGDSRYAYNRLVVSCKGVFEVKVAYYQQKPSGRKGTGSCGSRVDCILLPKRLPV